MLRTVYGNLTIKTFKAGQTIIREGENGDSFFILYSGEVLVSSMTPSGDSIALATVSDTQNIFFGETSIIGNDVRSATVTAKTQCNTLIISGKKFSQLCDAEPVLGYRVLSVLAKRLANTVREINHDKVILYQALCNEIKTGV